MTISRTPDAATTHAGTADAATAGAVTSDAATADVATADVATADVATTDVATTDMAAPEAATPHAATPGAVTSDVATPAYRRLSVEERRAQLLAAALDLFGHHRPEDVSIDDVAAAAGVSRPLVYRYFPGGKQQLYEAALRSAAEELRRCFERPGTGPPTRRLAEALGRYFAFVDEHAAAYAALLRGGSVAETSRTNAIVDGVRRSAAKQILRHLGAPDPGPRLAMTVRSWIASVEVVSLTWLDEGRRSPADELRDWLVDHFTGLLLVSAVSDPETAAVTSAGLAQETPDSPAGVLAGRLAPLVTAVLAPVAGPGRLDLAGVEALARQAHRDQVDKAGRPYAEHVAAVARGTAARGGSDEQIAAGWLHDTVEDGHLTRDQLLAAGVAPGTVEIVMALTRRPGEPAEDYAARLLATPGAPLVKEADIAHNADPRRLAALDPATQDRLGAKYARMRKLLGLAAH